MLRNMLKDRRKTAVETVPRNSSFSLAILLWTIWTCGVAIVAYSSWHVDMIAQRPINLLGLVIHSLLAGIIGLVIMTMIELRLLLG